MQEILAQTRHIARPFTATIATNTGLAPTGYTPATPRNLAPDGGPITQLTSIMLDPP